jgi:hypothetical protein
MEGENMRTLCFALLVLVCALFTSMAEAGTGFGVEAHGGSTCVVTAPVVIYTPSPVVSHGQQPVEVHESHQAYQSNSCGEDGCNLAQYTAHYKDNRFLDDDDD